MLSSKTANKKKSATIGRNRFRFLMFLAVLNIFFMAVPSNATDTTYDITLPQRVTGVEKLEYAVNGTPKGVVDGTTSVALADGAEIYFSIKIASTGYTQLLAKNVKIVSSDQSVSLSLKVRNSDGTSRDVTDTELIDSSQTYTTSVYTVSGNESFSVQGVTLDKFSATVGLDSSVTGITAGDALNVTYSDAKGDVTSATYNSANGSYVINDITLDDSLQVWITTQDECSQSQLTFTCSDSTMTQSSADKSLSIPAVTSNVSITVSNLAKNQYTVSFTPYTGVTFEYKKSDSQGNYESVPDGGITVTHGDSYLFICETTDSSILSGKEFTANGTAIRAVNGIYSLNNISGNTTIAITGNTDTYYGISLPSSDKGIIITDTSGNTLQNATVKYGNSFAFKTSATAAYTQSIDSALIYAVPQSKLVSNDYDPTADTSEAATYLLTPSNGVYTISSVKDPMAIIVKNLSVNTYLVTLPQTVTGAYYSVALSDSVKMISSTSYVVNYGTSVEVTMSADVGKDVTNLTFTSDTNPSVQVSKSGSVYTIENITSDTDIIISAVPNASYGVTFTGDGISCTDGNGIAFSGNATSIVYGTGVVTFKVQPTIDYEIPSGGIGVNVSSGNATLTAPSGSVSYYTLSNATGGDVTVEITGMKKKTFTVSLASSSTAINFVALGGDVLPSSNTVDYGSTFNFKLVADVGTDISKVTPQTNNGATVNSSEDNSYYYLSNITQDVTVVATLSSDSSTDNAPSQWEIAKNMKVVSDPLNACTITPSDISSSISPQTYLPSSYSLSSNTVCQFTINFNSTYGANDLSSDKYKFYYDSNLQNEITNGMYSPDAKYQIYINKQNVTGPDPYTGVASFTLNISVSKSNVNNNSDNYFQDYDYTTFGGGIENDMLSIFGTIYVAADFKQASNIQNTANITFSPPPKGATYYNAAMDDTRNIIVEKTEISQLTTQLNKGDIFYFIVQLDDGYTMDSSAVKVLPAGQITLTQYENVSPTGKSIYCYGLSDSYASDVEVYIENASIETYTGSFSGNGTNFLDGSGNQFLSQTLNYNSSFSFTTESKDGYVSGGLTFKLTTSNGDSTLTIPTADNTQTKITDSVVNVTANYNPTTQKITYTLSNVKGNFSIAVTRSRQTFNVYFEACEGITYQIYNDDRTWEDVVNYDEAQKIEYERNFSFNVKANEGYDITNMTVTANHNTLDYINGRYTIRGITEDNTVRVENVSKNNNSVTFTQYDGVTFKDADGNTLSSSEKVDYGAAVSFKVVLSAAYSGSSITVSTEDSSGVTTPLTVNSDGIYTVSAVTKNIRIYIGNLSLNTYSVKFAKATGISYYNQYETETLPNSSGSQDNDFIIQPVTYGNDFSFKIVADTGYDISNLTVFSKKESTSSALTQMFPANGVYTLEDIAEGYTITTKNVSKSTCQIEFRIVDGGTCLDSSGNAIGSTVSVSYGSNYTFNVSLGDAYNNSTPTVTLKGTNNAISPNSDKSYTLTNITSNEIIDITSITKNSYTATFKAAEGVEYRTSKNKVFTGTQSVEYGNTLYFKVALLDAYDKSTPWVMLNDTNTLVENGGVYSLEDIRSDVEVEVKNVVKNPEEVTMDDVNNVPTSVTSSDDVDTVVTATQTYNQLTDTEKAEVLSTAKLEAAQQQAGEINHKSGSTSISGVDWNIKVIVSAINSNTTTMTDFAAKVDRKSVLSLYEISLFNVLTNTTYTVPYGTKVTVNIPTPDLTGYENTVVAHENSAGSIEYLDVNVTNGTGQFETSSFSLFGVAAKQIPNYAENPSSLTISVSSLVDNTQELQSLLGEGLSSQIGSLISEDEDNGTSSSSSSSGTTSSSDTTSSSETTSSSGTTSSLLTTVSNGISSGVSEATTGISNAYSWATDNELIAVIIVLAVGSILIAVILIVNKKRSKKS